MDIDWYRALGTALVVGIIGPLFWLGVNVLENRIRLLLGRVSDLVRARKAQKATAAKNRLLQ